jgi:hypothetical protein
MSVMAEDLDKLIDDLSHGDAVANVLLDPARDVVDLVV